MINNYDKLCKNLIGMKVNRPGSGTLSGHAAGEPFEKHVYSFLKEHNPDQVFKQFEYLNNLYSNNLNVKNVDERHSLVQNETMKFLINRGQKATREWTEKNLFEEKQNDTADIIIFDNKFYDLLDIKTRNISKKAQAPNIISSYKLAQACYIALENKDTESFTLSYLEIDWRENKVNNTLVCEEAYHVDLFKEIPEDLYINWAAALQIQFHVSNLKQNYDGTKEDWMKRYLKHFATSSEKRTQKMYTDYVEAFKKYL